MDIMSYQCNWAYPGMHGRGEEAETLCRAGVSPILPRKQLSEGLLQVPQASNTSTCGLLQLWRSSLLGHHLSGASFSYPAVFCPLCCKTSQWIYFPPDCDCSLRGGLCPVGWLTAPVEPGAPVDVKCCLSLTLALCSVSC